MADYCCIIDISEGQPDSSCSSKGLSGLISSSFNHDAAAGLSYYVQVYLECHVKISFVLRLQSQF